MLTASGHHIGDSWYCADGERVHCFYLICPHSVARHTAWDIAHASSVDLRRWVDHGIVLRRGSEEAWDGICLATGTVLRHGGRFWMAYTGNWFGPQPAVGLAVSADLHSWSKVPGNPITAIDERYYTAVSRGRRPFPHWRDPFLLEIDGAVYQLVCATAAGGEGAAGTVGAARSDDMVRWDLVPALDVEPFAEELECPQVVSGAGRFYLVFSTPAGLLLSDTAPSADQSGNMYSMVGDSPLGPFRVADPEALLPEDMVDRPYAGRIVNVGGRHYLLGTVWRDVGDRLCDPIPVELRPTGVRVCV
jgi:beta-fructofuranosidase